MTRMAPKPTAVSRATATRSMAPAASETGVLRWRVGRRASLALVLAPSERSRGLSTSPPTSLPVSVELVGEEPSRPGASAIASAKYSGDATVSRMGNEWTVALRLRRCDADAADGACVHATLVLVESDEDWPNGGHRALVLTDLPVTVGLRGGTYALAQPDAESTLAVLRAHASS